MIFNFISFDIFNSNSSIEKSKSILLLLNNNNIKYYAFLYKFLEKVLLFKKFCKAIIIY